MTDHADIVRGAVRYAADPEQANALAALDALVAERDEARQALTEIVEYRGDQHWCRTVDLLRCIARAALAKEEE